MTDSCLLFWCFLLCGWEETRLMLHQNTVLIQQPGGMMDGWWVWGEEQQSGLELKWWDESATILKIDQSIRSFLEMFYGRQCWSTTLFCRKLKISHITQYPPVLQTFDFNTRSYIRACIWISDSQRQRDPENIRVSHSHLYFQPRLQPLCMSVLFSADNYSLV